MLNKNNKNTANIFWEGSLTLYEKMTINSFIKNGFYLNLWSFSKHDLNGLDKTKINNQDANKILSQDRLKEFTQNYQKNNLSSFTNLFRYKLLKEVGGWWFDADCVCLKNIDEFLNLTNDSNFVIGKTKENLVNGSVMHFTDGVHMQNLIDQIENKLLDKNVNFKWGEIGPYLLTNYFDKQNLLDDVLDFNFFYEISPKDFSLLFNNDSIVVNDLTHRLKNSYICHYWNEMFRRHLINKGKLPPQNSTFFKYFENYSSNQNDLKIYNKGVNFRFKKPFNFIFKFISRLKSFVKNLYS